MFFKPDLLLRDDNTIHYSIHNRNALYTLSADSIHANVIHEHDTTSQPVRISSSVYSNIWKKKNK